jgi:hypothetical protein
MKKMMMLFLGVAALSATACVEEAPTGDELAVDSADSDGKSDAPGSENYTYYSIRPDIRRCAFPMCGGFWVSRVNRANLRCHDGRLAKECYVAEIDWAASGLGQDQIDAWRGAQQPLFRGEIVSREYGDRGAFGVLSPSEFWAGNNDLEPDGVFARITDSGIRCITTPCNSLHEAKLNAALEADIAELDFYWSGANEDEIAKAHDAIANDGLLVTGYRYWFRENRTWAKGRDVTQFWRRVVPAGEPVGQEGEACGSRGLPFECAEGLYCARDEAAICGWADAPGVCSPRPEACIEIYQPVCGCDNQTYGNSCTAASAGVSVQYQGECTN